MKYQVNDYLLFIFLTVFSITEVFSQPEDGESSEQVQKEWLEALSDAKKLASFYSEYTGLLFNDVLYTQPESIVQKLEQLNEKNGVLKEYNLLETFQLRDAQKFEFGKYTSEKNEIYYSIIGWKKRGRKWTKEFETIYENIPQPNPKDDLVQEGRGNWVKYSNEHRPDLIAEKVFSTEGYYFNRGKKYDADEIAQAYNYMNNENYKIELEAMKVFKVNESIILEVGTFHVGGKGLYTLIWKKEKDDWKLLLDFNF